MFTRLSLPVLLLTVSLSVGVYGADSHLSAEERAAGWTPLFDGKNLSRWRNYQSQTLNPKWIVEDGAMLLSGKGGGDLITRESFGDFELQLEWKISEGGNSGIFFLADETGTAIYAHAPEVQILDNERHSDNQVDSHLSGSLYDMIASPQSSHKPAGEWNHTTIRLQNNHLQIWQNGVVTASIVIGSTTWKALVANSKFADWKGFAKNKRGHIGLQDHGDPVWFRNIKIREL